jgi:hypothetical protein
MRSRAGFAAANQARSQGPRSRIGLHPWVSKSEASVWSDTATCTVAPSKGPKSMKKFLVAGAVASLSAGVFGFPVAHAAGPVPDLPAATPTCKLDTSPNYPSCVGVLSLGEPPQRCSTSAAPHRLVATCDFTTLPARQTLPTGTYLVSDTPAPQWVIVHGWRCTDHGHGFQVCEPVFTVCDDDDPLLCASTT